MNVMQAVVLNEAKKFDSLKLQEVSYPEPGLGEVVVQIKAAALNHRDVWIVQGLYAGIKVPVVLGSDGAGVVHRVSEGVPEEWLGKAVLINPSLNWGNDPAVQGKDYQILGMPQDGTQAEFVRVPVANVVEKPEYLSWEEAAAIPLAGLTGYRALFTRGGLQAGETVLLTGIGGGVASLMLKMALSAGAVVAVTSGDEQKIARAVESGALGGANYREPDWPKKIRQILGDRQIDLVVDSAGGTGFDSLIGLVKPGGRLVFFGATAGNAPELNLRRIFWKQLTLLGTTMGTEQDFARMIRLFETHRIQPPIDRVFPFSRFQEAYRRMMEAKQFGKIVLKWEK